MSKRRLTDQQQRRISHLQQRQQQAAQEDSTEGRSGLVISQLRNQAEVLCPQTGERHRCHLRANLPLLAAGDAVTWSPGEPTGVVLALQPRRNSLIRPDSFGKLKLVAANIDRALIVVAPEPEAHANLIDRYLVACHALDIEPVLLMNKADRLRDQDPLLALLARYGALGYTHLAISAHDPASLQVLQAHLAQGNSILVGQSGVGKSSILQALLPDETLRIGELSQAVHNGKHTPSHSRLYPFAGGGACIDSPGIREFGLGHLDAEQVAQGFIEFLPFLGRCKFRNCQHQAEPGCALRQALEDGAIEPARFQSYQQILGSLGGLIHD